MHKRTWPVEPFPKFWVLFELKIRFPKVPKRSRILTSWGRGANVWGEVPHWPHGMGLGRAYWHQVQANSAHPGSLSPLGDLSLATPASWGMRNNHIPPPGPKVFALLPVSWAALDKALSVPGYRTVMSGLLTPSSLWSEWLYCNIGRGEGNSSTSAHLAWFTHNLTLPCTHRVTAVCLSPIAGWRTCAYRLSAFILASSISSWPVMSSLPPCHWWRALRRTAQGQITSSRLWTVFPGNSCDCGLHCSQLHTAQGGRSRGPPRYRADSILQKLLKFELKSQCTRARQVGGYVQRISFPSSLYVTFSNLFRFLVFFFDF